MYRKTSSAVVTVVATMTAASWCAHAGDWPMWRHDAERSAASPDDLPRKLELLWEHQFTPRKMVWYGDLNQDRMPYDRVFEPIVLGKRLFVGFNDSDKVLALDTDSGEVLWTFYTDGPVRFAPVGVPGGNGAADRVLFTSDDGYLYCLDAADGALLWKFRGGPSDRKVLGNARLISMWPARGGPVARDGVVYFAASIWPFMGTFVYALDIGTGEPVWVNDRTSFDWINQPHRNPSFAGVAPQGALVLSGDALLVPGGRSVPAGFDAATGEQRYFHYAESREHDYGKTGGSFVCATRGVFFNHESERRVNMYGLKDGYMLAGRMGERPVLTQEAFYFSGETVCAAAADVVTEKPRQWGSGVLWRTEVDASGDLIKAGKRLYAAGAGQVAAIDIPKGKKDPKAAWTLKVDGNVERLLAADDKLFAVTLDGRIMAFAAKVSGGPRRFDHTEPKEALDAAKARQVLAGAGVADGYALVYGVGDASFIEGLTAASELLIVALDPDAARVTAARERMDAAGLYGTRVAILQGDPSSVELPPYLASLTVVADPEAAGFAVEEAFLKRVCDPMRPYGGKLWLPAGGQTEAFAALAEERGLPGLTVTKVEGGLLLSREGPLPGSAYWTHQYGNVANTVKSDETNVQTPLGLLWFGGNSNMDVLPRHGHGPSPQVIGGRLFVEGIDCINARDVYTGRPMWQAKFGDMGTFGIYFDETYQAAGQNQRHTPGANIRGTNYVATLDKVYVVQGADCHVLDAATGAELAMFSLPPRAEGEPPEWGFIGVYEDLLIGGCSFADFTSRAPEGAISEEDRERLHYVNFDESASLQLVVMDRHTGDVQWSRDAHYGFIHNAVVAGGGKVYCLDKVPPYLEAAYARRGRPTSGDARAVAFDAATGDVVWQDTEIAFGSWLGYSDEHDLLLQATRNSSDMVRGEEGKRMVVYRAADGVVAWDVERGYSDPPILHGGHIITYGAMHSLFTGEPVTRANPLTDKPIPWRYERTKGCGYHIACESMLTFRSSAAAFYDLAADGGTGHFGGFKSGCSVNLIAADGVLNAPDYTRTCRCSYQNQSSLAFVHMPEVEVWTTYPRLNIDGRIQRLGLNLGAPGDRKAHDGMLWLEYPAEGGASPGVEIAIEPETPERFLRHSSCMEGDGLGWIGASGIEGLTRLKITLANGDTAKKMEPYRVRLYFAEMGDAGPGDRVMTVRVQGKKVLDDFDVVQEAGGPRRTLVREFEGVNVKDALEIELAQSGDANLGPILSGIEILAE